MTKWEAEMAAKDKKPPIGRRHLQPVRQRGNIQVSTQQPVIQKDRIKGFDYRSWDKFDVDKALEAVDYQPETKQDELAYKTAEIDNDVNIEESLVEKEKGNAYYKRKDYMKAAYCYGKSMKFDKYNHVPIINRAMCYLKLERFREAEGLCNLALDLDPKNLKAFWRRGKALMEQGKLADAQKGYYNFM